MPLEVCKLSRSPGSKICNETDYEASDKGHCDSQNRVIMVTNCTSVCSIKGVFQSLDISPASVHDIHFVKTFAPELLWIARLIFSAGTSIKQAKLGRNTASFTLGHG